MTVPLLRASQKMAPEVRGYLLRRLNDLEAVIDRVPVFGKRYRDAVDEVEEIEELLEPDCT